MPELPDGTFRGHPEYDLIGRGLSAPFDEVWLLNASALFRAVYFPEGKLDFPVAGFASPILSADRPPPGRTRFMIVDGVASLVANDGTVTPIDLNTFLGLLDTPNTFAGAALQSLRVNAAEDGIEFAAGGGGGVSPVREMPSMPFGVSVNLAGSTPEATSGFKATAIAYGRLGLANWHGNTADMLALGTERVVPVTGHQTSFVQADIADDPTDITFDLTWRVPDDWTGFASDAIRFNTKVSTIGNGGNTITFRVIVFDPDDATTVVTKTRAVVGVSETSYVFVTVTAADLAAVTSWAGKLLRFRLEADMTTFFSGIGVVRLGEIEVNPA